MNRTWTLSLVIPLLVAGCLQIPEDGSDPGAAPGATFDDASMTARATDETTTGACPDGDVLGTGGSETFCATRVVTVTGTLAGIPTLDVTLETFNGDVAVRAGEAGRWGFVATLEAAGDSPDAAQRNLDKIELAWSHENGGRHFLDVAAERTTRDDDGRYAARIEVEMPPSQILRLSATTSNGDVDANGVRTEGLALRTSNGRLTADADVTHVDLVTSNGDIDATLAPTGSGRIRLTTSNGEITLAVPEDARRGYEVDGRTSNGEVDIRLKDGDLGDCPRGSEYYTPPCNHRTFRTHGFDGRDVRSSVALVTSNGDIGIGPS